MKASEDRSEVTRPSSSRLPLPPAAAACCCCAALGAVGVAIAPPEKSGRAARLPGGVWSGSLGAGRLPAVVGMASTPSSPSPPPVASACMMASIVPPMSSCSTHTARVAPIRKARETTCASTVLSQILSMRKMWLTMLRSRPCDPSRASKSTKQSTGLSESATPAGMPALHFWKESTLPRTHPPGACPPTTTVSRSAGSRAPRGAWTSCPTDQRTPGACSSRSSSLTSTFGGGGAATGGAPAAGRTAGAAGGAARRRTSGGSWSATETCRPLHRTSGHSTSRQSPPAPSACACAVGERRAGQAAHFQKRTERERNLSSSEPR
mmetsp:Transcript_41330/g.102000  ORF Transcript_41330/g.102000 Transcript_41330/m.102000 type:complete len:322 (+) Transcript_41330:62-1027(+)